MKISTIAKIIVIAYIIFIGIFAFDSTTLLEFLIHLIPNFVLLLVLVLCWNKSKIAGYVFLVMFVIFTIFFETYKNIFALLLISLPLLVISILFLVSKPKKIKKKKVKSRKKKKK